MRFALELVFVELRDFLALHHLAFHRIVPAPFELHVAYGIEFARFHCRPASSRAVP